MSGFVRTIQRSAKRKLQFNGRGSRLGFVNPEAKDKLAREAREQRRLTHVHVHASKLTDEGVNGHG